MSITIEEILIYLVTAIFCASVVYFYIRKGKKNSATVVEKINVAKQEGRFEPNSLHPYIDLNTCIGSAACVKSCPEKDILGIVDGKAYVVNATSCVGHGACFHSCPVEAISLRIGTETRGVDLPHVNQHYETNVRGIYIAGELGGMGLIKNSVEQGKQAIESIAKSKKARTQDLLDVIIVGAGPAGIGASLMAKQLGLRALTLEQGSVGGTVFSFPRSKIVMTHPMDLPLFGKIKLTNTSKQELLEIWKEAISKNEIQLKEQSKVEKITPQKDETFKVILASGDELIANHVIIAIGRGGTPRKLGILGEDLQKVSYRLLEPEEIEGQHVLVVGGGDSAVESALLLKDKNTVTLSYRKEQFARIKPKNAERIAQAIAKKEIDVLFNSEVVSINPTDVLIAFEDGDSKTIKNDLVYIFIGGELPISFLQNAGIKITKRFGQIVKKY
jgi:thioredoxin reductase (NADPH)